MPALHPAHLGAVMGIFSAAALCAVVEARAAEPASVFEANCAACHQVGGIGTPGLAPPLVSRHVAAAARSNPNYAALVVLNGLSGSLPLDDGSMISGIMPPVGRTLSDEDVAGVVSYIYQTLNGADTSLDAKMVAGLRAQSHTAKDLRTMREGLEP